jgi:hypothetical protein
MILTFLAGEAFGTWTFELFSGAQYNVPMPLTIRQDGFHDLTFMATYDSRPFEPPVYFAWRIGRWHDDSGWEVELVHQKLFLRDQPEELENFAISHGYNLLTINRAWQRYGWQVHLGLGLVVTHPETTVRAMKHPEKQGLFHAGYYISGPTTQVALGRRFYLWRQVFATLEGKLTGSFARVPVSDGSADVPNVALHGLFGIGVDW